MSGRLKSHQFHTVCGIIAELMFLYEQPLP